MIHGDGASARDQADPAPPSPLSPHPVPAHLALLVGLAASGVILGCWIAVYALGVAVFPPLDAADAVIRLAPGRIDTWAIDTFGHSAQRILELSAVITLVVLSTLGCLALRLHPTGRAGLTGALLTLPIWVLLAIAAGRWPSGTGALVAVFALAGGLALGGRLAGSWMERLAELQREQTSADAASWLESTGTVERRAVLTQLAVVGCGILLGGLGLRAVAGRTEIAAVETGAGEPLDDARSRIAAAGGSPSQPTSEPPFQQATQIDPPEGIRPRATSNADFYIVDISTRDPALPELDWSLKVFGLVTTELRLTWLDLLAMPALELDGTLMCISYTHGSDLISNTRWTGVPLRDVLQRAGVGDGVVDVVLRGANGYSDSIPLAKALETATLLAYGMNGTTLPRRHGFPCRVYVPGLYGEKNVKWLQSVELVSDDYQGYWQERGWTDIGVVNTISTIDTPSGAATRDSNGIVPVGGIAFAGSRGISGVELQIDGADWQAVEVEEYAPLLVWQRWRFDWQPAPGVHHLAVRAIDGAGVRQIETDSDPHPNGLTGLYRARIRVN